ncbi:MAG: AAA family ATPase, partial [Blautia sp.]|nr:AAA family ATPase [Blautia sp.]
MNIRQAKETIGNTVRSYLEKDDDGAYYIPAVQQRPLLLMGPPGIGKTAIVEQLAAEYGIGLVSYNMTHHTRQSAVGLPHPADREYNGKTVTVTEYTLSEIVASVYDCMEDTGKREGILFIDEINCVSETLAPCMLQFLQKKRFGSWQIPEGWVIVAAGNPRVFNRSARDYDIAVLDRLRTLSVQPDLDVWMSYAQKDGVHGAVLSYLAFHREHFFIVRQDKETTEYVTARGWQDLSTLLFSCERLEIRVDQDLVFSYLAVREIAEAFTDYYMLFRKCRQDMEKYGNGSAAGWGSWLSVLSSMAESSDSQECHILAGLLLEKLGTAFARYAKEEMLLSLGAQRFEETERTLKARNTDEEPLLLVLGLLEKWKES